MKRLKKGRAKRAKAKRDRQDWRCFVELFNAQTDLIMKGER